MPRHTPATFNFQFNTAQSTIDQPSAVHQDGFAAADVLPDRAFDLEIADANLPIDTPPNLDTQVVGIDRTGHLAADRDTPINTDIAVERNTCTNDEVEFIDRGKVDHGQVPMGSEDLTRSTGFEGFGFQGMEALPTQL